MTKKPPTKTERDLVDRGVILAKPITSATHVTDNIKRIATTQGEDSIAHQRQQKLLDRVVDLEWDLNQK